MTPLGMVSIKRQQTAHAYDNGEAPGDVLSIKQHALTQLCIHEIRV